MLIKRIVLENIGPFIDSNIFDFNVSDKKNIVLIGGKNGSGKTTLLKAIKFGLFGPFSLGLKNDSKKYYNEIYNLINTDSNRKNSSIIIDICIFEDLISKNYTVKRNWIYYKDRIEELCEVLYEGEKLNDYDIIQFFERIKSFTSPQLINSCMFDGEKIGNIIENDEISTFIKQVFDSIFNINLLKQLSQDLNFYLDKKAQGNISTKEIYLNNLIKEINNLKNSIKSLDEEITILKQRINDLNNKKRIINKDFVSLGGLTRNQQKQIIAEAIEISQETEKKQKLIKNLLENDVCFCMNFNLLNKLSKQLESEIPLNYLKSINKMEDYLNFDLQVIKDALYKKIKAKKSIHSVTDENVEAILYRINSIQIKYNTVKEYYIERINNNNKLYLLKNALSNQVEINKFDEMITELDFINNELLLKEQDLAHKNKKNDENKTRIKHLYDQLEYVNNEIRKSNAYDKSFIMATRALRVNELFERKLIEDKLDIISQVTLSVFNDSIRKKNYISKIVFDDDFNIHIYDIREAEMNIKKLSAGEMQLLISSIIWAMFKVSGRKEPFIFDTPLARLDIENRISFIENIVKTIGKQVIVLSTDSEIVDANYDALSKNISKKYRLDFIEKTKSTKITKGYF